MNLALLRFVVFVLITAFMVVGPIYRQVFDGKNRIFRSWTMFSGIGTGIVDAHFTYVEDDGSEVLLDRYEILGLSRNKKNNNPKNSRSIRMNHGGALQVAERICGKMEEGSVIKIYARVATKRGWATIHNGSALNCKSKKLDKSD